MTSQTQKITLAAALSGGVDSSLAAALLLESGYKVVGLYMDLGPEIGDSGLAAQKAADHLGLELVTLDLKDVFEQRVRALFLDIYQKGLTPNPCAMCNREVKFKELLAKALDLGASGLATGHYAQIDRVVTPPALLRGVSPGKEQSYFLARLKPKWLSLIHFPLGGLTKDQVRRMAQERGLPSAQRAESQEACFLGGRDYRELYRSRMPVLPGPVVDQEGRVVGEHQGLFAYTVGQRRGLGIPAKEPYYVLALDAAKNTLRVGPKEALYQTQALVREVSWLVDPREYLDQGVSVQVRYRARPLPVDLDLDQGDRVLVRFREPQRAVAPGQLAAFFCGERVLGGGWLV